MRIMPEVSNVESSVSRAKSDVEVLLSDLESIDINSDASSNAFRPSSPTDSWAIPPGLNANQNVFRRRNWIHLHQTPSME